MHDLALGAIEDEIVTTDSGRRMLYEAKHMKAATPKDALSIDRKTAPSPLASSEYPGLSRGQQEIFESLSAGLLSLPATQRPPLILLGGGVFSLPIRDLFPLEQGVRGALMKPFRQFELWQEVARCCGPSLPREAVVTITPSPENIKRSQLTISHDRKILVAEDNSVMQELALRQLRRLGVVADAVSNGIEAVAAAASGAYSLILMDCQMPEMDGYEATLSIRKEEARLGGHIPIIAMTASAMKGDRETCIASGMDDYLSKPVGQGELFALLEKWLPSSQSVAPQAAGSWSAGGSAADQGPAEAAGESAPAIDFDSLIELYGEADLQRLLESFDLECQELIEGMQSAIQENNQSELARLAHQLKGLAVVMTAPVLAEVCKSIELKAKRSEYAMDNRFDLVKSEFSKIRELIAAHHFSAPLN